MEEEEGKTKVKNKALEEDLAIFLEDVSTIYEGERRPAIKGVSISIRRKELVYIVGPNASGKTTLLETINGLLPLYKGRVFVLGLNVRTYGNEVRREIGYVPQDFMFDPGEPYKALDVVLMGRYGKIGILRRPKEEDLRKAMETLRLMGIDDQANKPVGKLSGGQQQKVMIARALAKEPKILLMDEPFSNLDPDSRERIPELIGRLHEERGLTTVIVTHDVHRISRLCRRVIVMGGGRIVADEGPENALTLLDTSRPHILGGVWHHDVA
ncbi:ABC transporter ATP-binding protein [Candidatus Bathyarchaeota archaeon]|nr:ABC transporter ATP-binding protein [Candidatus Bathyarchaeota archaeon]MBS7627664.1 ABC transporter ATP-binding protein [Candidatus Bathyarchaeota archaeon]